MMIIIGIILWILFFIALEQTIVRAIKRAHREIEEEKRVELEKVAFEKKKAEMHSEQEQSKDIVL